MISTRGGCGLTLLLRSVHRQPKRWLPSFVLGASLPSRTLQVHHEDPFMMGGVFHLLHLIGVICLFAGALSGNSELLNQNRRCLGQVLNNQDGVGRGELFTSLHERTTCQKCPSSWSSRSYKSEERKFTQVYHVLFIVSDDYHEFTSLAAGLLTTEKFNVTIAYFNVETKATRKGLFDRISALIPCQQGWVLQALTVMDVAAPLRGFSSFGESDAANLSPLYPGSIEGARNTISALFDVKDFLNNNQYSQLDLLVMDATLAGGLLLSELDAIPTVAIGSHQILNLAVEHAPGWTPNHEWHFLYRIYRIILQRLYSISLTWRFLELNELRRELGRRTVRSPVDYFLPVVAILVEFSSDNILSPSDEEYSPNRVHVTGPLQSPCTPCLPSPTSKARSKIPNSTIVMVAPPPNFTAEDTRTLIRGLTMARASLENYDECEWDSYTCQNEAIDFAIVWIDIDDNTRYFPEFVPPYIIREASIDILDSVSRHPKTIAAVVHCDSDAHVLSMLGVSVLCISQSERLPIQTNHPPLLDDSGKLDSREIAVQLLSLIRRRHLQDESNKVVKLDGLSRAVSLVEQVAETHQENRPWKDAQHMQKTITQAIHNGFSQTRKEQSMFDQQEPYDTLTVLVAWMVVFSSILYVLVKDSLLARWRPRRAYHRGESLSDGILTRLPDLDEAWALFVDWYSKQPGDLYRANSMLRATTDIIYDRNSSQEGDHASSHHNHHHGNIRRRRKR